MIIELVAKKCFVGFLPKKPTKILIKMFSSSVKWDGIWEKEEYSDAGEH